VLRKNPSPVAGACGESSSSDSAAVTRPAFHLLDGRGRVRFQHFGEGAYEETEQAIRQLLGVDEPLVQVDAGGMAEAADWDRRRSPEVYVGRARGQPRAGDRHPRRRAGAERLGAARRA
jgi:hypothetical protein